MTRRLIVGAIALLLAVTIVRNSAVDAFGDANPARASAFWKSHPSSEIGLGMTEIASAARARTGVSEHALHEIADAALKAPLSPEPFLVHGVQAQLAGQSVEAERAFLAAERRDPRSLPAHYFLAEHFFRERDAERTLKEVASLANLSPGGVGTSAPYLAAFARDPANWPRIRALFRTNPRIEDATLIELSRDGGNAAVILALASREQRNARSSWLPTLLNNLVQSGEYARAKAIWASVSGVGASAQSLLFDPDFSNPAPPPPFNWALTSSTVGLAERQSGGRLHAIFYGQEDGTLAEQLVLLRPGRYHLSMRLLSASEQAQALVWTLTCAGSQTPVGSAPLTVAAQGWIFDVPANCPAQTLRLSGVSGDLPKQSDVTISGLQLGQAGNAND